jgi:AbrB family looped-hinge helix DNA binding protein
MTAVTLSPKFQIVIPREVRERLELKPGQRIELIVAGGTVHLIPVRPVQELRGFLRGIDTDVPREEDREI